MMYLVIAVMFMLVVILQSVKERQAVYVSAICGILLCCIGYISELISLFW